MFGIEDWVTDEERGFLNATFPVEDLYTACYVVYVISLLRCRRAPEHLENMMLLTTGNGWARMYFEQFVACVRPPVEVVIHEGSIFWGKVEND